MLLTSNQYCLFFWQIVKIACTFYVAEVDISNLHSKFLERLSNAIASK